MTDTTETDDIHALLARHRVIATVWQTADVREIRPDLSCDQAWRVLQAADRRQDASVGITWDVLSHHAEALFGPEPDDYSEPEVNQPQPEGNRP